VEPMQQSPVHPNTYICRSYPLGTPAEVCMASPERSCLHAGGQFGGPEGPPPAPPTAWQHALHTIGGVVHFFGRISFLVDENAHAFHFFISALLQLLDRFVSSSQSGEIYRSATGLPAYLIARASSQNREIYHDGHQYGWGGGGGADKWGRIFSGLSYWNALLYVLQYC